MTGCACPPSTLDCRQDRRRRRLLGGEPLNGLDYLEVEDDQRSLCVHFFGRIPEGLGVENVRICGGRRIRDIRVTGLEIHRSDDPELDDCLRVQVDRAGDFSTYCLCLGRPVPAEVDACGFPTASARPGRDFTPLEGFDPRYACLEFSFKAGCPTPLDCPAPSPCEPAVPAAPAIDYLAKDYAGFRRLLLDRLAVTMPGWRERHVPDLGVAVVEVLAYAADRLSYRQDAVAAEAYIGTARRRISIRRHLRLVDYHLHEGCNARAFLVLEADGDLDVEDLREVAFAATEGPAAGALSLVALESLPEGSALIFEPLAPREGSFRVAEARRRIRFHTWGGHECCLPAGGTRATLVDDPALHLRPGDFLVIEEVLGPTTGDPADADPGRRHVVRLTAVQEDRDPLLDIAVVEIEWGPEDALPFAVCLSATTSDCRPIEDVSVARGNVILVDHGLTRTDEAFTVEGVDRPGPCGCEGAAPEVERTPRVPDIRLARAPVTHAPPAPDGASAAALLRQNPRDAEPQAQVADSAGTLWRPRQDLLESDPDAAHFVVEVEDGGLARLRFGDGEHGRRPDADSTLVPTYRVGNGRRGNVGADSLTKVVWKQGGPDGLRARNPLPASGGADPEDVAEAIRLAPGAIGRRRRRAVIDADYAELAAARPGLQGAAADLLWTGAGYEAAVAVDPLGAAQADPRLRGAVEAALEPYRRLGHDLAVVPARYVPLLVELTICVEDGHLAAHVLSALRARLGARGGADGRKGFFHPDNLRFGEGVAVSRLVAEAQGVGGVRHVEVTRLERAPGLTPADRTAIEEGVLALAPGEIARVDDDPSYPENGALTFVMRGGR